MHHDDQNDNSNKLIVHYIITTSLTDTYTE